MTAKPAASPDSTTAEQFVLDMFASRTGRKWLREAGRPEISRPHFPLGWLLIGEPEIVTALNGLVAAGTLSIVELPRRVDAARTAEFVVDERGR